MSDHEQGLKQILYISCARPPGASADLGSILEQSRHNNALDGVTGLLYSGDGRYLQLLEGPADSVDATYARILADVRHYDITLLAERAIASRQFGYWSMAWRDPGDPRDAFDARVERLLMNASEDVRRAFIDLVTGRADA